MREHLTDVIRIIKQRNQFRPVMSPDLADGLYFSSLVSAKATSSCSVSATVNLLAGLLRDQLSSFMHCPAIGAMGDPIY